MAAVAAERARVDRGRPRFPYHGPRHGGCVSWAALMPRTSVRVVAIVVIAMPCVVAGTLFLRPWVGRDSAAAVASAGDLVEPVPEEPLADWCAPGFDPIAGGCLANAQEGPIKAMIVYLHGRYARDAAAEEIDRQRRLALKATKSGYAVLALRSRLGVCSTADLADWYCWPTSEAAADAEAVGRWSRVVDDVQRRVGAPRRYLLGFSSGGYFAGMVVSRGWVSFDAVVVAHGGPVEPLQPANPMPPMLLLSADDDVAQLEMMRFDDDLRRQSWPHDAYARAGAHGLADGDVDAALAFFARSGESMPLRPPLPLHRAAFHVREAGPEVGDDAGSEAGEAVPAVERVEGLPAVERVEGREAGAVETDG